MADILIATTPVPGHVHPLLPIARELVIRGHAVRWYTGRRFAPTVERVGAEHHAMAPDLDRATGPLDVAHPDRAATRGLAKLRWDLRHLFLQPAPGHLAELDRLAASHPWDAVVADSAFVAAGLLHERDGHPMATVGVTPLTLPSRDTAPFGTALPPSATPAGRLRNRVLTMVTDRMVFGDAGRYLAEIRTSVGLPAEHRGIMAGVSPLLHLQNGVAALEYPRSDLPPQVHFVGALTDPAPQVPTPSWWPELETTTRPIVHVTQGTVANHDLDQLVLPTARALATRDVLVVATLGRDVDPGDLPANVRVAPLLPYDRLLPRLSAMVTNGGYGGVQQALAAGVPLVVAGASEDKPEVAARVAWSGAGIDLRTARPGPRRIRAAVHRVLDRPGYRTRAQELRAQYRRHDAAGDSATLVERLVATRAPVRA